jgi:hypothetical protein
MRLQFKDHTGKRFGRWTAQWPAGHGKKGRVFWLCLCRCGTMRIVLAGNLVSGKSRSCGCLSREVTARFKPARYNARHRHCVNGKASRTYTSWDNMIGRCYRPSSPRFKYYGAKDITVCEQWHTFDGFLADLGERPVETTLGRLKDVGNYEPGNVRWMTPKDQSEQKRLKRRG